MSVTTDRRKRERQDRLDRANALLQVIACTGREFFRTPRGVAKLDLDKRGRVWLLNDYSGRPVYLHTMGRWRGFSHGGTLRRLVERLRDYVKKGEQLRPSVFGPWPEWICGGDLWGYGESMEAVRSAARALGVAREFEVTNEDIARKPGQQPGWGEM